MRKIVPFTLVLAACDPGGWKVLETDSNVRLEGVFVAPDKRILAAGDKGTFIEYDGEEVTTTSTDADIGPRLPGFYGVVSTGGVDRVAGDQGTVLVREGTEFLRENSRTQTRLLMLMAATATILYAAGESGRVIRKTSSEERWERVNINAGDAKITGGWAISDDAVAFTTDTGLVIDRVEDRWVGTMVGTGTSALPLFDCWSSTAGADMYAVGLAGSIFKRAAGEEEFLPEDVPGVSQDLYGIYGTGPDRIFAVGARGTIVRWDGTIWKVVPSGTAVDLFDIHATEDGGMVAASGDDGILVLLEELPE